MIGVALIAVPVHKDATRRIPQQAMFSGTWLVHCALHGRRHAGRGATRMLEQGDDVFDDGFE